MNRFLQTPTTDLGSQARNAAVYHAFDVFEVCKLIHHLQFEVAHLVISVASDFRAVYGLILVTALPDYETAGDSASHNPPGALRTLRDVVSGVSDVLKKHLVQPGSRFLEASLYVGQAHDSLFQAAYASDVSGVTADES